MTTGCHLPNETSAVDDAVRPGAYWKRGQTWWGMTPNGLLCNLSKHAVQQHEDGTITVSPSIAVQGTVGGDPAKRHWHGFLEHGVWREG